jgi:uncharacterized OB-fold protein
MPEISLPESLQNVEAVRSVRTPAQLDYIFTPGEALSRFLRATDDKKLLGERAPGGRVYIPPRGADPELGLPTSEQVEVEHTGTLVSFCMVNVAFYGSQMELPYTSGWILLDGSDMPIMHLIQEIPASEVRIGLRVEAVWEDDDAEEKKQGLGAIKWFRPNGEPDDPDVRIGGEGHGTGLGSWVGGVAPTEALVRNPRTGEGGEA